jgi:para-nitrobenzyl esterase
MTVWKRTDYLCTIAVVLETGKKRDMLDATIKRRKREMKKLIWVSSMVVLAVILSLGGFVYPVQADDRGHDGRGNHWGLLKDPIKITDGYISGTVFGDPDDPVRIYRGIPYAAPPVGNLRWKPPQPVIPWSGIRECVDYSTHPVQFGRADQYYPDASPQSEDALYLNVLTPAQNTHEKLPVIVWIHGGGMGGASGNDVTWNFHRLPQHGVVLVTVNTRLGALGLLAHPSLTSESPNHASGNYMFLDVIASLKWVQNNIDKFGGDPRNVTLLGESSGGMKITTLLASPLAKGLFHRAIIESGAGSPGVTLTESETWGQKFFDQLGVTTLEEARAVTDLVKLRTAYRAMPKLPGDGIIVDGWFLKDTIWNTFSAGKQNAVPLIAQAVWGELGTGPYPLTPYYVKLFEGNLKVGIKGYASEFNQVPANWKANGQASFHALDLAYTFGIYDDPKADMWVQMTARTTAKVPPILGEKDKFISEAIMTMWAQFAKTGNPNVKGLVYWPAWSPSGDQYIYMEDGLSIKTGYSEINK